MFTDATARQIKHVFQQFSAIRATQAQRQEKLLSYSYVLYKVCELLELDDILHAFTLLKSRANLMKADVVWRGICKDWLPVYSNNMNARHNKSARKFLV